MARYSAIDLAGLPQPKAIVDLDYAAILQERLHELKALLNRYLPPSQAQEVIATIDGLESDPLRALNEAAATRELHIRMQINRAILSVFLSTADGSDLDHKGASMNPPVYRQKDEADERFRARIQLAAESRSPHGAEGSYVFWALDADESVIDARAYGPDSDITPPIAPANAHIVISTEAERPELIKQKVQTHLQADKRRPVGDKVSVYVADWKEWELEVVLYTVSPEAADLVEKKTQEALQAFTQKRLQIGQPIYIASIAAVLKVHGVHDIRILKPSESVAIAPYEAPKLTKHNIRIEAFSGGWRDG